MAVGWIRMNLTCSSMLRDGASHHLPLSFGMNCFRFCILWFNSRGKYDAEKNTHNETNNSSVDDRGIGNSDYRRRRKSRAPSKMVDRPFAERTQNVKKVIDLHIRAQRPIHMYFATRSVFAIWCIGVSPSRTCCTRKHSTSLDRTHHSYYRAPEPPKYFHLRFRFTSVLWHSAFASYANNLGCCCLLISFVVIFYAAQHTCAANKEKKMDLAWWCRHRYYATNAHIEWKTKV